MQLSLWRLNRYRTVVNKVCQQFVFSFFMCLRKTFESESVRGGEFGLWRLKKTFALDKEKLQGPINLSEVAVNDKLGWQAVQGNKGDKEKEKEGKLTWHSIYK